MALVGTDELRVRTGVMSGDRWQACMQGQMTLGGTSLHASMVRKS